MTPRQSEYKMTAEDWKAFKLVWDLLCEVHDHGRSALLPFAEAIVGAERKRELSPCVWSAGMTVARRSSVNQK